jgi:hypothetical protein
LTLFARTLAVKAMTTFVPNSTFGRKVLRNVFEREATYVSAWLLNVPSDAPGDRSTWTWAENWKNYRVQSPYAYTTNGSVIDINSQVATPPTDIALFEEGTHVSPGAYYIRGAGATNTNQYTYFFNTGTETLTFTHYAVFTQESQFNSLSFYAIADADRTNNYLTLVRQYATAPADPDPVTLAPGQAMYVYFDIDSATYTGGACNTFSSYADLVLADKAFIEDLLNSTGLYSFPYTVGQLGLNAINQNKSTSPFLRQAYTHLLGFSPGITTPVFLAELLNVTDPEPDFDSPWSSWSSYSITRYTTVTPLYEYTNETEQDSYTVDFFGDTVEVTFSSDKIKFGEQVEFVIAPPASGTFTFTHLALFLLPTASAPPPGQAFNHSDTDAFVGVIKLNSALTMTTSSTARAYPFNLGMVFNPQATFEQL